MCKKPLINRITDISKALTAFLILFSVLLTPTVYAQQSMSLSECIEYAKEHNQQYKIKQIEKGVAKATVKESVATGLPQVTGSFQFTNNLEVQKSLVDASNFNPNAPEGEIIEIAFGLPFTSVANVGFSQLLFNGSYFVGVQAAKTLKQLRRKELEVENSTLVSNVMKAYFGVLVNQERLGLLETNLTRLDTLLFETQALFENGFAENIDVSRIKIAQNNTRSALKKVKIGVDISKQVLKFQMGMPVNEPLSLTDNLDNIKLEKEVGLMEDFNTTSLSTYQLAQTQLELAKLDLKLTKSQHLPSINLSGNLGYNYASPDYTNITTFDKEDGGRWRRYAGVSIGLAVPLFDGFGKRHTAQIKRLKIEQSEQQIQLLDNSINLEISQSKLMFNASLEDLKEQSENMKLAEEIFDNATLKYKEGVGSNLEVIEAETAFKESQTNYYASLYDALIAKVNIDKALGKFEKL